MQRRLDLAASLVGRPRVLFLDEPTTGLDPRARLGMWDIIRSLVAGGTTLLLTTQYLDEADELANEIVVIDHGLVIAAGTSEELKNRVGGDVIEFTVPDRGQVADAVAAIKPIGEGEPHADSETGVVGVGVGSRGSDALIEAVRALDAADIASHGLALRRPSLDDVFLTLTGHAAEDEQMQKGVGADRVAAGERTTGGGGVRGGSPPGIDCEGGIMTAITGSAWAPGLGYRIRWGVSDTLTLTKRSLLVWFRVPAYILFTVIQPVIFVLLFRFVFGGAIPVNVPGGYVNFLMPGIIAQTAAFATFGTAIVLAQELKKGVIDRLKSMPIARSAVLTGRLVADTGRMLITILIIVGVGYAVGFRFLNGAGPAVAMVVLATVFGVAIACISAFTGLAIGDEESVQSFGLIWLFPLTFVSSAFVPIATMPGWLQAFANHQPVTYVVNTMRAMALGGPLEPTLWPNLWRSLIWLAGIFIVFVPLAVRAYRRAA